MNKQHFIVDNYKYRLRNRNVKSMCIMILFQMADDLWMKFNNDKFVQSVYSAGRRKEVSESFNRVRIDIKNQFRADGLVDKFDEMMDVIGEKADELEHIAKRFRAEIQTVLVRYIPYNEVSAFSIAVAAGNMLLLANDAFCVGRNQNCKYFAESAIRMNDLLERVEIWRELHGCIKDEVADRLFAAVMTVAEREAGGPTEPKERIVRKAQFRETPVASLDNIAKQLGLKKITL